MTDAGPLLVLRGRGHPAVRATHAKTIELTRDAELGAGGTCIVAVSSTLSGGPAAGVVDLELAVGSVSHTFSARANPEWDPAGPAVIRRSDNRRPDTLATHATAGARDLPRELRAALTDPTAEVRLRMIRGRESALRAVLVAGTPSDAERAAADLVIASADVPTLPSSGRILVLGEAIPAAVLEATTEPVEVYGFPPERAVAVASSSSAPAGFVADSSALNDALLRESALVLRVTASELPRLIKSAQRHGRRTGAVLAHLPWVQSGPLGDLAVPSGARSVWVCVNPTEQTGTDAQLLDRIAVLRLEGQSTKALAKAISAEFGVPTNRVYALALDATTRSRPTSGDE